MIANAVKALLCREPYRSIKLTVRDVVMLHSISSPGLTLLRKWNLSRDVAYALIGDRGTGKSVSGAAIVLRDGMMVGDPCWSNLQIKAVLPINDDLEQLIREYEEFTGQDIERRPVVYESQELDFKKLLSTNPPYRGGWIYADEMNITMADSLRATMNDALATSDFMQLLRKLESGLVASCISEMFLPPRVREGIDVYIRTHDCAFINSSELYGQRQGMDYEWAIFPVTGKLAGYDHRFTESKEPWQKVRLHGKSLWGIVDTLARKKREKHVKHSLYEADQVEEQVEEAEAPFGDIDMEMVQSETVKADHMEWDWLYYHSFIRQMMTDGQWVKRTDLLDKLAMDAPYGVTAENVLEHFEKTLNPDRRYSGGQIVYRFNAFLAKDWKERVSEKVLVPA